MKPHPAGLLVVLGCLLQAQAQESASPTPANSSGDLRQRVEQLETEVTELKQIVKQLQGDSGSAPPTGTSSGRAGAAAPAQQGSTLFSGVSADDRKTLDFLHDTTINLALDTY